MSKTPDKLEAGMFFISEIGAAYILARVSTIKDKLVPVYMNSEPSISLHAGNLEVEDFVGNDKYLGRVDFNNLKETYKKLMGEESEEEGK